MSEPAFARPVLSRSSPTYELPHLLRLKAPMTNYGPWNKAAGLAREFGYRVARGPTWPDRQALAAE